MAAWDQDRVNRMMEDFVAYEKVFVHHGILLATSNNGDIDLSTPSRVLTATIKTAVSEHEISMMKIRMRRAAKQKAERGEPKWKRAFGYLGDTYQPDPHTAPLVKQAYAAVLVGSSLGDIARMFNDADAYGLTGRPWTQSRCRCSYASHATPGCAPTTATRSVKAPGRPWWTNRRGGQRNRCSTRRGGHRAVSRCDGTC